jgi:ADP-ribose pyrophosphatase
MTRSYMEAERYLSGETVFRGRIVSVRVDSVELPGGGTASREVVEHRPSVVVVPIDSDGNVVLVRQYRYPVGKTLLEAPAGVIEESEAPEACAQRELQEEVGYRARSLRCLGRFWTTPGFCDERMHVYLATDLEPSRLEPDPDENIAVERFPVSKIRDMTQNGEIEDAKTIAALLMFICISGED